MTKNLLKFVSFVTALCVLMSTISFTSFAISEEEYTETAVVIKFSPETKLEYSTSTSVNRFYSLGGAVDAKKYFYNQLTANQKAIYDAVWAAGPVSKISVTLKNAIAAANFSDALDKAMEDVMVATTALNEDNPLFCWLNQIGAGLGDYYTDKISGDFVLTAISVNISYDTKHFSSWDDVKTKQSAIIQAVNSFKVNGISRHEKLKSIHDQLADKVTYDSTISKPNIFDAYGAFINGVCVCEGYAEALKLICDREGIPCITVVGTGNGGAHKWNMVQMEDGMWYTVDPTWDDQTNYTYYSYFLIGKNTKAPYFSHSTVADSTVHIPTGKIFSDCNTALSYPTLSDDTYGVGILRYGAGDVHFDTTRDVVMVGKDVSSYVLFIVNNSESGFTRTRKGSGTTTSTLTVSDGTTTKDYLVAMRGDVDATNSVNTTDYTLITQICATTYDVEENSARFYAGDMTQDNAIDGFDAIALDLYLNGELEFD